MYFFEWVDYNGFLVSVVICCVFFFIGNNWNQIFKFINDILFVFYKFVVLFGIFCGVDNIFVFFEIINLIVRECFCFEILNFLGYIVDFLYVFFENGYGDFDKYIVVI